MANKKGPLGKVETFYVDAQIQHGKSIEEIANDLNRPQSTIENYIAKTKKTNKNPNTVSANNQFVRQSGATIMTENASTIIDSKRKSSNPNKCNKNCITKIKDN